MCMYVHFVALILAIENFALFPHYITVFLLIALKFCLLTKIKTLLGKCYFLPFKYKYKAMLYIGLDSLIWPDHHWNKAKIDFLSYIEISTC